jgi:phytoene synthase
MDDLADNVSEEASHEHAHGQLTSWRNWLAGDIRGAPPDIAGRELASVIHRHSIPTCFLVDLLDGLLLDLESAIEIKDYVDLRRYSYHVASTVGICMAHIFGCRTAPALAAAAELGIAMQITNILRDVGEDLDRGRIYLPADEMAELDLDREELVWQHRRGRGPDARLRALIEFQVERCYRQYELGMVGIPFLPLRVRPSILLAARMYRAILKSIERNGYDVLRYRAATTREDKLREAALALISVQSWVAPATAANPPLSSPIR